MGLPASPEVPMCHQWEGYPPHSHFHLFVPFQIVMTWSLFNFVVHFEFLRVDAVRGLLGGWCSGVLRLGAWLGPCVYFSATSTSFVHRQAIPLRLVGLLVACHYVARLPVIRILRALLSGGSFHQVVI